MAQEQDYERFGAEVFGPFLYGFVRWLKAELIARGYDKVFFFSRDGYMMQKAFDRINDTAIRSEYVYFSRKALRAPLLTDCTDYADSLKYLARERFISIGKLLDYYGFPAKAHAQLAAEADCTPELEIPFDVLSQNPHAQKIFTQNRDRIAAHAAEQAALLERYLRQTGMQGRFAIADVGWHGNMQYYLEQFCKQRGIAAEPGGFYIGILPVQKLRSPVNGYVYSPGNTAKRKQILSFFGLFEKLLQSAEGSAAGYAEESTGEIVPLCAPYEFDTERDSAVLSAISALQNGALRFVSWAESRGLQDTDDMLTAPLMRFGMYPTVKDVQLFSAFYNTDGTRTYYTAQKPLYRYQPKEFLHALANSPWKTGFMKSAFRLPLPYYAVYSLLRK